MNKYTVVFMWRDVSFQQIQTEAKTADKARERARMLLGEEEPEQGEESDHTFVAVFPGHIEPVLEA